MRLRQAVDLAGGTAAVARLVGMPAGTLHRYRRGREMQISAAIDVARATGVSLAWLLTGEGPMRAGELQAPPAAPPDPRRPLFGQVKIDRLVQAYEGALASTRGADKRLTMHLTVVLYDQLTEAAESQGNRASPADAPATAGATTAGVEP